MRRGARRRAIWLLLTISALAYPGTVIARSDTLLIGTCSVETPHFCGPGELEKKKREASAAEAKRRRDAAERAERERLANDPAYRAKKDAEVRNAALKAAEAKRIEDIKVAQEAKALGLPAHRTEEARTALRLRLASEQARKPLGPPPPGIFGAASPTPAPAVTQATASNTPPPGPKPTAPKACLIEQKNGPIAFSGAHSEAEALLALRRETQLRCTSIGRPVPYTLTGSACTSANYAMKVKVLPDGKTVRDTSRADDIRWTCKATYSCAVQRCETGPAATSRQ